MTERRSSDVPSGDEALPADLPSCLLAYRFSTVPSPLQVSPPAADSAGMINVWVSAPAGQTVYCSRIVLAVPLGDAPTDLGRPTPSVTPNTTWWAISSLDIESGAVIGLDADTSYAIFTAVCASDAHWKIDYDLAFSLVTSAVNTSQGTFGYVLVETSGSDPGHLTLHRDVYGLTKTPVVTYLDNLVTTLPPPGSTTLPATEFSSGQPIRVAWESNADSFALCVGADAQPVWTGPDTSAVLSGGLTADTTIAVVATGGGATVRATTSVTVSNPTLRPASIVAGALDVTGTSTLAGTTVANASADSATVTGVATLSGPTTAGSLVATGGTALHGQVDLASATVGGGIGVTAAASLGAVSAATLRVSTATRWFSPRGIGTGGYVASSDGLVLGTLGYPSDVNAKCVGVAYAATAGSGTVYAVGGNVGYWTDGKKAKMTSNPNTFVLPVRRNAGFSVDVLPAQGFTMPPTAFFWVPFGTSATLRALDDTELASYGLDAVSPPAPVPRPSPIVSREVVDAVDAIADLFGDRLTPPLRRRLRDAVLALATAH